jgi:O-Antigen ligase
MRFIMASVPIPSDLGDQQTVLFRGIFLRWQALTRAEQVVCLGIVLIPLWWLWGWSFLILVLAIAIVGYEFKQRGQFLLGSPSAVVLAAFAYGLHSILLEYFYGELHGESILNLRSLLGTLDTWAGGGLILWYIQSRNIRVRPVVVAWAFSVVVLQMFLAWAFIVGILHQAAYTVPRSIFGMLTAKGEAFVPGAGNTNYLLPYFDQDASVPGFVRYGFFFHGPESLALVAAFICLLAAELKSKVWSLSLFGSSGFILLLSGTRSVWLALPSVLMVRWVLVARKTFGIGFLCALLAVMSFTTLSVPPVTKLVFGASQGAASSTANFRGDSTKVRQEIYERTWEEIERGTTGDWILGRVKAGEEVLPGYAPAVVGSHSFYLGTLLYRRGILGTVIFLGYWASLIGWFYQTRQTRLQCCLLLCVLLSLTWCVMAFESVTMPLTFICAVLRGQKPDAVG